ncbi:unnamed protein product [Pedinophyceae sp. YPF-701]|nr:unnamed protein product [Pedinophyceae sp. YPF-701]
MPAPTASIGGSASSLRAVRSLPSLQDAVTNGGAEPASDLEVYVLSRPFEEFGKGVVPSKIRQDLVEIGICHFMLAFRNPSSGNITQFDFGPCGGDVHKVRGPLGAILNKNKGKEVSAERVAAGEIRENTLSALPSEHFYVGRTRLTIEDIRAFNTARPTNYELHKNDCRHYVNELAHYAAGFRGAVEMHKRRVFLQRRNAEDPAQLRLHDRFWNTVHVATDAQNWQYVAKLMHGSMLAATALVMPRHLVAQLGELGKRKVAPLVAPAAKAIANRPLVAGSGAAITTALASTAGSVQEHANVGVVVAGRHRNSLLGTVVRDSFGGAAELASAASRATISSLVSTGRVALSSVAALTATTREATRGAVSAAGSRVTGSIERATAASRALLSRRPPRAPTGTAVGAATKAGRASLVASGAGRAALVVGAGGMSMVQSPTGGTAMHRVQSASAQLHTLPNTPLESPSRRASFRLSISGRGAAPVPGRKLVASGARRHSRPGSQELSASKMHRSASSSAVVSLGGAGVLASPLAAPDA